MRLRTLVLTALAFPFVNGTAFSQYRIYISADMEGVVGAVTGE